MAKTKKILQLEVDNLKALNNKLTLRNNELEGKFEILNRISNFTVAINLTSIRSDLKNEDFIFRTCDETIVDPNKQYPCITIEKPEMTAIWIEKEWRSVNNIDFE